LIHTEIIPNKEYHKFIIATYNAFANGGPASGFKSKANQASS